MADKPKACPDCGYCPVAEIIYGEVKPSDAMIELMRKGEMDLGGCFVIEGAPTWRCTKCGREGGKLGPV